MESSFKNKENTFYAADRQAWRGWLQKHHGAEANVWLIIYRKQSGVPSVYYDEAVDEALCFGWIDSIANKRDEQSYFQYFAKRKPKSNWSKVNKQKVAKLTSEGLMVEAGLKMVALAQQTGTWTALNDVDERVIPDDLQSAFEKNKAALKNFKAFSNSAQRGILEWINTAKRPITRQQRIEETVKLAAQNIKANN